MIKNIGLAKYGKESGFTLVELLVVISIIAILSVVSVAGYTQFIGKAKESNCVNELTQFRDMLKAADEDDDNYFIFEDDGVIYAGVQKSEGVLPTCTDSNESKDSTTTADTKDSKSLCGLVKKYFPDMLTSKDGETRDLSIDTDGKVVTFTWSKDGKTITTTWTVDTGLVEASTADTPVA